MTNFQFYKQQTQSIHGGQTPDAEAGARAVPIYESTAFVFPSTESAQNRFALTEPGNIYTRITNPTVGVFEQRIADLEDGVAAVATSSGMAAITYAILNIAHAGDEIVTDSNLYGGTYNLFVHTLPKYGITVKFVDGTDPENFRGAITDKTKAIFGETITNPSLNVFDIETVADIAHENGIPLIIDNTFATPFGAKPISWGADIVVHSATKWIGGHGTSIGGVIVDGGRFNWDNPRFPEFSTPDESYNGIKYVDLGAPAYALKVRVQLLRDTGSTLSANSAFNFIQGIETLSVRFERLIKNTKEAVKFLENHPGVEWVNYPGNEGHPSYELSQKYLKGNAGSVVTFGIKGGREAGRKVIDNINIWSHVANVGDAKSLIIHNASTTHQQLSVEDLKKSGTSEELIRVSIGLEEPIDVLRDLDQAIAKATGEPEQLTATEEDVIQWLLHSPFDRSEGLRQKTVAILDADENTTKKLSNYGFNIVTDLTSASEVDAVFSQSGELSQDTLNAAAEKQAKIVWIEADTAKAEVAGAKVITGKQIVEELNRIR